MVSSQDLTVVFLKAGKKYPAEYYNILKNQIEKNISVGPRFICLTDNSAGMEMDCIAIPYNLPTCWGKIALFDPKIKIRQSEYILFLDVDSIIIGHPVYFGLDDLIEYKPKADFIICRDFFYPRFFNSSVFRLRIGSRAHLWERYCREKFPLESPEIASYDSPVPGYYRGDQCFITQHVRNAEIWPEDWIVSYKKSCIDPMGVHDPFIPENARIVTFHGRPKPWDLTEVTNCWVKDYWP